MKILLDSGAYSAWTRGLSIDLAAYIGFLEANQHLLDLYVSLDVIPGEGGRRSADPIRIERAAQQSYRNQQIMKDYGLSPIPVFHRGEEFKWLERYLADDEPYVALAPHGTHPHNVLPWFDRCFKILSDKPQVAVHGLSVTTCALLRRYPFTSVDSSSWAVQAGHGQILVPIYCRGHPDYSHRPEAISVTDRTVTRRNHLDRLDRFQREQLDQFLKGVGVKLDEVRSSYAARWRVCLAFFHGLEASSKTRIFHVTTLDSITRQNLLQCGVRCHLLSYQRFIGKRRGALEDYVRKADDND